MVIPRSEGGKMNTQRSASKRKLKQDGSGKGKRANRCKRRGKR